MKKLLTMVFWLLCGLYVFAQETPPVPAPGTAGWVTDPASRSAVNKKVADAKTNTSWDIIADLYQLSLNDITGTGKSLTFGATLHAIASGFNNSTTKPDGSYFTNNFQPVVIMGYKNNYKNINASGGFKYAVFNQTDALHSKWLNHNPQLLQSLTALNDYDKNFRKALRDAAEKKMDDQQVQRALLNGTDPDSDAGKAIIAAYKKEILAQFNGQLKQLTALLLSGKSTDMSKELRDLFDQTAGADRSIEGLIDLVGQVKSQIDEVSQRIVRGWNVNVNPMVTYDLTHGGFQGLNLGATGSKGFNIFGKGRNLQVIGKFNYIIGSDTIVAAINTGRRQITDQLGFNQVIFSSLNKSVSKTEPTPWLEASLTGSYNYVFSGLKPKEEKRQPALNLKVALLVGKSTWFTVPFTYNFGTKSSTALISVTANIGQALF
jgi:hypothetical protein